MRPPDLWRTKVQYGLAATALVATFLLTPPVCAFVLERESIGPGGVQGDGFSGGGDLSYDGRYLVFSSQATNLLPGRTTSGYQVFLRDRLTGENELLTINADGDLAKDQSVAGFVSPDGRFVLIRSWARNLVAAPFRWGPQSYVYDRHEGTLDPVSVSSAGDFADGPSGETAVTPDGRFAAFISWGENLSADDTNGTYDLFLRDRATSTTRLISIALDGQSGNDATRSPSISAGGDLIVFHSVATNLVPQDTNAVGDIFLADVAQGTIERISVDATGAQANGSSYWPQITPDGRWIVYYSNASNLVADDTDHTSDVFVFDRHSRSTTLISRTGDGRPLPGGSTSPSISDDGRYVAFTYGSGYPQIFVKDRTLGALRRLSETPDGEPVGTSSYYARISGDGRFVAFQSNAPNLVAEDTNNTFDVFVHGAVCGDGLIERGEECDDGNTLAGDCCSATCRLETGNCDDGNACTDGETCTAGLCGGGTPIECASCESCDEATGCVPRPRVACRQSAKTGGAFLRLANGDRGRRSLTWSWTKGQDTTVADLGDPTRSDAYAFCLYGEAESVEMLLLRSVIPPGGTCGHRTCWRAVGGGGSRGFRYRDQTLAADGIERLQLRPGETGRAKIVLKGRGSWLALPSLPLALPLRAQLHGPSDTCWEATYGAAGVAANASNRFAGSSD